MAKIKRKVEMKPKEFLKHLLEQEETKVELDGYTFDYNEEHYSFDPEIKTNEFINYSLHSDTFTVEVEEEITEDTVLPKFLEIYEQEYENYDFLCDDEASIWVNSSIKEITCGNEIERNELKAIYVINNDMTMTLVWKDGRLVD